MDILLVISPPPSPPPIHCQIPAYSSSYSSGPHSCTSSHLYCLSDHHPHLLIIVVQYSSWLFLMSFWSFPLLIILLVLQVFFVILQIVIVILEVVLVNLVIFCVIVVLQVVFVNHIKMQLNF